MEFPEAEAHEPKICSLDSLEVDQTYTFSPPLDVAVIHIVSKHRLGGRKSQHPNFLKPDMQALGVAKGKLIYKSDFNASGEATGTFSCEARFQNKVTGIMETVQYTAACKFSRRPAQGIQVMVRNLMQDTLQSGGGEEE